MSDEQQPRCPEPAQVCNCESCHPKRMAEEAYVKGWNDGVNACVLEVGLWQADQWASLIDRLKKLPKTTPSESEGK